MNSEQYRPAGFSWLSPVIKNLLIINILFFIAQITINRAYGTDIVDFLGLRFPGAESFRFYQVITYMFLHGDFWHLFFNMFALWMFGKPIEERMGAKRFIIYYFVTGIGAAAFHYAAIYFVDLAGLFKYVNAFIANPDIYTLQDVIASNTEGFKNFNTLRPALRGLVTDDLYPYVNTAVQLLQVDKAMIMNRFVVIGASGAVFGILLAFGMMFPNSLIYIYFAIPIKAKWFVILYGALELFQGIRGSGSNIAHLAHVGGMIFGFILIKIWNRRINRPKNY